MKKSLLFVVATVITLGLSAQITTPTTVFQKEGPVIGGEHVIYLYVWNESGKSITPDWLRFTNDMPGNWGSRVCIGELCYDREVGSGAFLTPLANNDSSQVSIYIDDDTVTSGQGHVELAIYDPNDSLNSNVSISYTYTSWPVGIEKPGVGDISVYPNPSTNQLFVDLGEVSAERMEVIDLTGRVVDATPVPNGANRATMDVSRFAAGTYFMRLMKDGEVVATQTFQRK